MMGENANILPRRAYIRFVLRMLHIMFSGGLDALMPARLAIYRHTATIRHDEILGLHGAMRYVKKIDFFFRRAIFIITCGRCA